MLRKIIKLGGRTGSFLAFKPQSVVQPLIYTRTVFSFGSQPPPGFEKFKRKRPSTPSEKEKKESEAPKEQRIEPEEENLEQKEKQETKRKRDQRLEEEWLEEERHKEDQKPRKENKVPEEEEMEAEEKPLKKKKKKKDDEWEDFKIFLNKEKGEKTGKGGDPKPKKYSLRQLLIMSIVGFIVFQASLESYYERNTISYLEFYKNFFETDKIRKISIRRFEEGAEPKLVAVIHLDTGGERCIVLGNPDNFLENLERLQLNRGKTPEQLIPIEFEENKDISLIVEQVGRLATYAFFAGVFYFLFLSGKGFPKGGAGNIFNAGKSQVKIYGLDQKVKTRFADVAGLDEAKVEIMEFVDFLKKPQKFHQVGAKIPRGALLTGPPGTGKTLLAKAAAGEAGVPFLYISGSDFVEMYVGVGASRVRDLFAQAKEHAPSMIFIDEIDAVGKKRESKFGGNDEKDNTLNQLLVEMDGFGTDTNVVILAATNMKDVLDPALTRPGRFDRSIEITLPDIEGRKQIFHVHLKGLKLDPSRDNEEYAKRLAVLTPGFSGADIANLCNEAAILAARKQKEFVTTEEFELASERVIAGLEKKRIISEEERKTVAVHESGHAVTSWFLEGGTPLVKLTIIPRSKGSLGYAQYLPNESSLETKEELMDRITCVLGGRCAEELFFNRITTGAYDDLQKAYEIANAIVTKFGMSEKIGLIGFNDEDYVKKYSGLTAKEIDDEIKSVIDECTERARATVRKHQVEIEKLSSALLEKETLDLEAILGILGERPFPPKSNFKAYLEYKKKEEKFSHEREEENKKSEEENQEQPAASQNPSS